MRSQKFVTENPGRTPTNTPTSSDEDPSHPKPLTIARRTGVRGLSGDRKATIDFLVSTKKHLPPENSLDFRTSTSKTQLTSKPGHFGANPSQSTRLRLSALFKEKRRFWRESPPAISRRNETIWLTARFRPRKRSKVRWNRKCTARGLFFAISRKSIGGRSACGPADPIGKAKPKSGTCPEKSGFWRKRIEKIPASTKEITLNHQGTISTNLSNLCGPSTISGSNKPPPRTI